MGLLQNIALAIKTTAETVTGLTVYPHETFARALTTPALTIGAVDFTRTHIEEAESQVGSYDRMLTWALTLYVALNDPAVAFPAARDLVDSLISAFDAQITLNGAVYEAKLFKGVAGVNTEDANRRLIVVEIELETLSLVAS